MFERVRCKDKPFAWIQISSPQRSQIFLKVIPAKYRREVLFRSSKVYNVKNYSTTALHQVPVKIDVELHLLEYPIEIFLVSRSRVLKRKTIFTE